MSEEKRLYSVISLLLIYGLASLLNDGYFILPLPFLETIFVILAFSFAYDKWKFHHLESLLMVLASGFLAFSKTYNYQFFMDDEQIMKLDQGIFIDLMYLGFSVTMILLFLFLIFIYEVHKKPLPLICVGLFITGVILNLNALHWPLYLFAIYLLIKERNLFERGNSFWIYPMLFEVLWEIQMYFA